MALSTQYRWKKFEYNATAVYRYSNPIWGAATASDERSAREYCRGYSGDVSLSFDSANGFLSYGGSSDLTVVDVVYFGAGTEATEYSISGSGNSWYVYTRYGTATRTTVQLAGKGNYIEDVTSATRTTYPNDGVQGSYWYTYVGSGTVSDAEFSFTATHCTGGANNGSITCAGYFGSGTYQFKIGSGGAWASAATFTNLAPATYTVYGRDAQATATNDSDTVTIYPDTAYSVAVTEETAAGDDGTVTVTASGGSGSFQYDLGDGYQNSPVFTGLSTGTYTLHCKDSTTGLIKTFTVYVPSEVTSGKAAIGNTIIQGVAIGGTVAHLAIGDTVIF